MNLQLSHKEASASSSSQEKYEVEDLLLLVKYRPLHVLYYHILRREEVVKHRRCIMSENSQPASFFMQMEKHCQ